MSVSRDALLARTALDAATDRRQRWLGPTHAATVVVGVALAVVAARRSRWRWLLVALPLVPDLVWRLATVYPEDRAYERWQETMDGEDG